MARSKPNYYAVARGLRPGIYKDWSECSAQVTGFSGSNYKGHNTLKDAQRWMREHNAEQHAVVLERRPPNTVPSSAGFRSTWKPYGELSQDFKLQLTQEIQASQGFDVKPGDVKQMYERKRTRAMHDVLQRRFFEGSTSTLKGYQNLCRAIRIEPSDTIKRCRDDLRGTLVNIVDLLDALDFDEPVKVWPRKEWKLFTKYTGEPDNCFHLEEAKKSKYLQCFLQKLGRKKPRRIGNPRPLRSVVKPSLPIPAPISPTYGVEAKEEIQFEGIGRLSPLASECTYEKDEYSSSAAIKSTKRGLRDMEDGRTNERHGKKRSRFAFASQITSVGETEEMDFEDYGDTIPSGQGDDAAEA